jgi:hypothetical protein
MYRADLSADDEDDRRCVGCWCPCETTKDEPPDALPASGAARDDDNEAKPNPFAQDANAKRKSSKTAFIGQSMGGTKHKGFN